MKLRETPPLNLTFSNNTTNTTEELNLKEPMLSNETDGEIIEFNESEVNLTVEEANITIVNETVALVDVAPEELENITTPPAASLVEPPEELENITTAPAPVLENISSLAELKEAIEEIKEVSEDEITLVSPDPGNLTIEPMPGVEGRQQRDRSLPESGGYAGEGNNGLPTGRREPEQLNPVNITIESKPRGSPSDSTLGAGEPINGGELDNPVREELQPSTLGEPDSVPKDSGPSGDTGEDLSGGTLCPDPSLSGTDQPEPA